MGLAGALFAVRKIRRSRAIARQQLPTYNESNNRPVSNHRRLTITAAPYGRASSVYVYDEKTSMIDSPTTPSSPVPEIRITFPDEHLPAYEKETGGRFHSIDMERIGGLKEKIVK